MQAWQGIPEAELERPKGLGWLVLTFRLALIASTILTMFIPLIILRTVGKKNAGQLIVKLACMGSLFFMGIRLIKVGKPMQYAGAVVANHSKAEVRKWPFIGMIARHVGTVFIRRMRSDAISQKNVFVERISQGDKLLFFPEGTSTDGRRVLPFKSSLFAAFFEKSVLEVTWIQPVTVNYVAPKFKRRNWYGWWAEMGFFASFIMILSESKQGSVELIFHEPLSVDEFSDRKELALAAEAAVFAGLNLR